MDRTFLLQEKSRMTNAFGALDHRAPPAVHKKKQFLASQYFRTVNPDGVHIKTANDQFVQDFLLINPAEEFESGSAIETVLIPREIRQCELELLLDPKRSIPLGRLWELVRRQPLGEPGILQNDGTENLCLVSYRLADRTRHRVVSAAYFFSGWEFNSIRVDCPSLERKFGVELVLRRTP